MSLAYLNMPRKRFTRGLAAAFLPLLLLLDIPLAAAATSIESIRVWRAPERTRVVFDLSSQPEYHVMMLDSPSRVVLDIEQGKLANKLDTLLKGLDFEGSPVSGIRSGSQGKDKLRLVVDLNSSVQQSHFTLEKNEHYGDRLVLDLSDQSGSAKAIPVSRPSLNQKRDIVIAIDAGHGGEDPGAIGARKVREKDVVLDIAKKLAYLINEEKGYRAELIRKGDYFLSLAERPELAKKMRADLMLSIHADAFRLESAHGASVYTLSERGSESAFAVETNLARRENAADRFGGALESSNDLQMVLTDLAMNGSKEVSQRASRHLLKQMKRVTRLHKSSTQKANFAVLRSSVPSLLVETGFISNRNEARKLNSDHYQRELATALYTGVKRYFEDMPPEGTYVAWKAAQQDGTQRGLAVHTVRSGETLSGIAQRYSVKMDEIRQLNGLSKLSVRIGQRLKIPG